MGEIRLLSLWHILVLCYCITHLRNPLFWMSHSASHPPSNETPSSYVTPSACARLCLYKPTSRPCAPPPSSAPLFEVPWSVCTAQSLSAPFPSRCECRTYSQLQLHLWLLASPGASFPPVRSHADTGFCIGLHHMDLSTPDMFPVSPYTRALLLPSPSLPDPPPHTA